MRGAVFCVDRKQERETQTTTITTPAQQTRTTQALRVALCFVPHRHFVVGASGLLTV